MRRVLVLGGTGWLGAEIARVAIASGADVTCLARGESGAAPEGATLVRADRREPGAYDALTGEWDEVVEISYDLDLVHGALDSLAERAAHWTLVSTISVYADNATPGANEQATLAEPADLTQYPDAKVAAERATSAVVGDRLCIARPGLIVGPGDRSDRFGYWPARLHTGGRVLAPDTTGRFVQVIDVRDLAVWIDLVGRNRAVGVADGIGPVHTLADVLDQVAAAAGFDGEFVTVHDETLLAHGVAYWAGPKSLPLWLPADYAGMAQRDNAAFAAMGGVVRPLGETIADTLADEIARGTDRDRRAGLTASEERAVLDAL